MSHWIARILKWAAILTVLAVVLIWLVLAAPFFSSIRKDFVARIITDQIGQPFDVEGDVRVVLGATTKVHVSGARIPSTNINEVDLATLNLLEWELNLLALLERRIDLDNLVIDGLHVNMVTTQDGTTSWIKRTPKATSGTEPTDQSNDQEQDPGTGGEGPSILGFLQDRTVTFTDIGLISRDDRSGFEFIFDLQSILLEQRDGGDLVSVTGKGSVNGEGFTLDGKYPPGKPFTTTVNFGDISVSYNGSPIPGDQGGGHMAKLLVDTGEIGNVFDVLGLSRSLEGSGTLGADITSQPNKLAIRNITSTFDLNKGQQVTVTGGAENLRPVDGLDIIFTARLHPKDQPPAKAESLKDLKLTDINARIISQAGKLEFKKLVIGTNAFDQGLDRVGPISIGRVYRTKNKTLGLKDVQLQAGPRTAPYIVARGNVGDIFQFKNVDLEGTLAGDSSLLLKSLSKEDAARFGSVSADFSVSDQTGPLSLTQLKARTKGTDLWSLAADISVKNVTSLEGLETDLKLTIAEPKDFLTALGIEPVDVGTLEFGLSLKGAAEAAKIGVEFKAGESDLRTDLSFDLSKEINVIRGEILSNRIRLADLRDGTKAIIQIRKQKDPTAADPKSKDDGKPPIQPLVLEKNSKILDLERILTQTDLEISLVLKEFVGNAGVSSMNSQFIAKEGQIEAGPLELFYGPGFFKVTAAMDAIENPTLLKVVGSTSGWNFGKILDAVGLNIDAAGTLNAAFDITGNITSGKTFINSMYGSASLNMGKGYIATSLLELAGLGIFPWLFSEELAAGKTEISCVKAPIRINAGRVRFDSIVAETRSVQLVAQGDVNWLKDTIALRAEPRRVGKPLARSAWPFEVSGQLSDPKFKLIVGGSRSKRTDGATEMPTDRVPCRPDIQQLK
ncbi:AsmA family protein (plasmid) [Rhodobacteraceae bacterium M382]|nr:AsmA family protein [Rhodobacteraceae bacterium M382]